MTNYSDLERFIIAIHKLNRLNHRAILSQHRVKPGEYMILHMIDRAEERGAADMNVTDIAKRMRAAKSTISPTIQALVVEELVERTISETDRRVTTIRLTDKGRVLLKQIDADIRAELTVRLETFGAEKTQQLITLLEELTAITADE